MLEETTTFLTMSDKDKQYIEYMRAKIAAALGVPPQYVGANENIHIRDPLPRGAGHETVSGTDGTDTTQD